MRVLLLLLSLVIVAACSSEQNGGNGGGQAAPSAAATSPKLGIRPNGDESVKPDLSRVPPEVKQVFDHIDANIDEHVLAFQKWIQQPSISNTGEGIQESAQMVKGFFDELGCQRSEVHDVGVTEYGSPGNPVVYARCDEGAPRTHRGRKNSLRPRAENKDRPKTMAGHTALRITCRLRSA